MTNEKRDRVTKAQNKKDTESAKKTKRILETAGEVFSVKKRDNNCSLPYKAFASLRLETSLNLFRVSS